MFSYTERLRTFGRWPKDYGAAVPEKLAIVGFACMDAESEELTASCVYCDKTLEGWERADEPVAEHFSHKSSCPLFNMHLHRNRMATFKGWAERPKAQRLARNGFVRYNLDENDFVFCYMCGSIDEEHRCSRLLSFEADGALEVFFYNILRGVYNDSISEAVGTNVYIPQHMLERAGALVRRLGSCGVLDRTEDAIGVFIRRELEAVSAKLEKDIESISSALDEEMKRLDGN
jgi:baculoviral IAP repeat-containing protein 5